MRKTVRTPILALMTILTIAVCGIMAGAPTANARAKVELPSFADLADELLPAVVNISSTQKYEQPEDMPEMPHFPPGSPFEEFFEEFFDRRGNGMPVIPPSSLGSGFIIDAKNGYVVTNYHVIKDADEVRVTLHDDTTIDAEIIGHDEKTDLALLQVDTDHKLVDISFGDSDRLRVGDWILAIGNPFGLGGTVTSGIISAQQRDIQSGPYDDYIQTDASINRGNSGGPMFDLEGNVIGINTAIFSPSGGSVGIGFAIPSNLAHPIIEQLIKYGKTKRGWLGVRIQTVTDEIAESLGLESSEGALVASVTDTGPAQEAGLQAGDVILEFNNKSIQEMRELPRAVAETEIGTKAKVKFWRDGKINDTTVTIGELEQAEEEGLVTTGPKESAETTGITIDNVGVSVSGLTDDHRDEYNIAADVEGVVITKVEDLSEAAEKGLLPGDVIIEINQQAISDPLDAKDIIEKAEKGGRRSVLLLVNREGDVRFVALRFQ